MVNSISHYTYTKSYQISLKDKLKFAVNDDQKIVVVNDWSICFLTKHRDLWDFTSDSWDFTSQRDQEKMKFLKLIYNISINHLTDKKKFSQHFISKIVFLERSIDGDIPLTYSIFSKTITKELQIPQEVIDEHLKTVLAYDIDSGTLTASERIISKLAANQFSYLIQSETLKNIEQLEITNTKEVKPLIFGIDLLRTLTALPIFQPNFFLTEITITLSPDIHITAIKAFLCAHNFFQRLFSAGMNEAQENRVDFTTMIEALSEPAELYHVGFDQFMSGVLRANKNNVDNESYKTFAKEYMSDEITTTEREAHRAFLQNLLLDGQFSQSTPDAIQSMFDLLQSISHFKLEKNLSSNVSKELNGIIGHWQLNNFVSYLKKNLNSLPERTMASLFTVLSLSTLNFPSAELMLFTNLKALRFYIFDDSIYESLIIFLEKLMCVRENKTFSIGLQDYAIEKYKAKCADVEQKLGIKISVLKLFDKAYDTL